MLDATPLKNGELNVVVQFECIEKQCTAGADSNTRTHAYIKLRYSISWSHAYISYTVYGYVLLATRITHAKRNGFRTHHSTRNFNWSEKRNKQKRNKHFFSAVTVMAVVMERPSMRWFHTNCVWFGNSNKVPSVQRQNWKLYIHSILRWFDMCVCVCVCRFQSLFRQ